MIRRARTSVAVPPRQALQHAPLDLLGGISPRQFMTEYWQRKPLLVRQAIPGFVPPVSRDDLFALAAREDVESRCVTAERADGQAWTFRRGPFGKRALPSVRQPGWSLLVQGVDIQHEWVSDLKQALNFIPSARLDDVMISYATDGGGVGPHFDSYDVFLLQAQGRRRWRIGAQRDLRLRDDLPLKILSHFKPEAEWVLEPGDLLYLPPRYAHDGIAEGECMTWSIGFRAPRQDELAQEMLARLADRAADELADTMYQDAGQVATRQPGQIPAELQSFTHAAVAALLSQPRLLDQCLGEYLTEPKPQVWFDAPERAPKWGRHDGVKLDRRSQMLYDRTHIYLNGESWRAGGDDARWMRRLADRRELSATELTQASEAVRSLLSDWLEAGWLSRVPLKRG
jgi:50S ribosomal protein L16 3-hydroxylase